MSHTPDPKTMNNGQQDGGLTKREYIAASVLQALLSSKYEFNPVIHNPLPKDVVSDAIAYTDELLKQLES